MSNSFLPYSFFRTGRLVAVILCFLMILACGKKMNPFPPDTLVPGAVRDVQLRQEGRGLRLQWSMPRQNIEGQPLTEIQGYRLFRTQEKLPSSRSCPPEFDRLADFDLSMMQSGVIQGEAAVYLDVDLKPGYRYYYEVSGYDRDGNLGAPSTVLSYAWDVLPQAPEKLEARAGDRVVNLKWSPVNRLADGRSAPQPLRYQLYRQSPGEDFMRVNPFPLEKPHFRDVSVANDKDYNYVVRAWRQVEDDSLESGSSPEKQVRPLDLTPPAPLLHLVAAATSKGIELRWDPSPEQDLAGYRIYRRSLSEPQFRRLSGELLNIAYYVDSQIKKGETYYYYVTAVDKPPRSNESLPSEGIEITY